MHTSKRLLHYALAVSATVVALSAYPNGRKSPRPIGSSVVKAICVDKSDGRRHEILRARLIGGDLPMEALQVRVGEASEQWPISQIKTLTLSSDRGAKDGFMNAILVRNDRPKPQQVMVQIGSAKSSVRLAGFAADSSDFSIQLARCKQVEFSSGAGQPDRPAESTPRS